LDLRRRNDTSVSAVREKQDLVVEMFATTGPETIERRCRLRGTIRYPGQA
jgi:hypothetical protein